MVASSGNTSATGGYLAPSSPPPPSGLELDTLIGTLVAGITGLPGEMVLPRWQETQPRIPDISENWVGVSVTASKPDDSPSQIHHSEGDGYTVLRTFWRLEVLGSFFGPLGDGYAKLFRDGLQVSQNREAMRADGLNLIDCGIVRPVPQIIATRARRCSDLPFQLMQTVERTYPIRNVLQADGTIRADASRLQNTPFLSPLPPA